MNAMPILRADEAVAAVELTILMPCLNEAETIGACVWKAKRYLASAGVEGEVLVADNGSTDGSPSVKWSPLTSRSSIVSTRAKTLPPTIDSRSGV